MTFVDRFDTIPLPTGRQAQRTQKVKKIIAENAEIFTKMGNIKKISIGVIGVGHLGEKHAQTLAKIDQAHLVGVCDTDEIKGCKIANTLGVAFFKDYRLLLDKVQAVIIAVPTKEHYSIAHQTLKQGCHALIEKPITNNLKQAEELIRLSKRKHLILQVGHIERFNNAFKAVCDIVKEPKFIECHRLSPFPARSLDIGVVADLMIHDIDLILDLVKSEVTYIDAVGINVLTPLEDIANVRLRFKNGCIANLTASRISDEAMRKFRIFLKNAYISVDYKNNRATMYRKEDNKIVREEISIDEKSPLQDELEAFLESIIQNKPPLVSGQEAKQALDLAIKIQEKISDYIKTNR
ncbi:MAG: Gfo/Idh/MocA family oxidoreductase [Candidatus Omnitrophota bacterium]